MNSLIMKTTARFLMPFLLLFSVFLFMRGHNEPGGGFTGGLVASAAFALYSIAFGSGEARRVLRLEPRQLIGVGLLAALSSGTIALVSGQAFLTGLWVYIPLPNQGYVEVGTPLLFDIGVYLVVIGVTLAFIFNLEEAK
jgi:multicomponent Na+:H+ antiporter subunit B